MIDLESTENCASGWLDHVAVSKGAGVYGFRAIRREKQCEARVPILIDEDGDQALPSADTLSRMKRPSSEMTTSGSPPNTGTEKRV